MPLTKSTGAASGTRRRSQFSLLAVLVVITDVAIFLACYYWLGKDGIALAALVAPAMSTPVLVKGAFRHKARMTLATILLTFGVAWSIMFPKSWDLLRGDTFDSILFGVGLIGGGLLMLWKSRKLSWMLLWSLLLWSVLLNLSLFNHYRLIVSLLIREMQIQQQSAAPSSSPRNLPDGPTATPEDKDADNR